MEFLSYLISGISLGSVYAIIALGYTMVYGIAKMLNFAHGDVIMVGGYISFCAMFYLGLPNIAAVLLAVVVCTVLGIVIERLAYKPLRSAPSLAVLITAIGVSYFLQNSALLIWKAAARVYPPVVEGTASLFGGQLSISYISLLTIAVCVVIMLALTTFVNKSKMGKAMRACSEDKGAAQLMGINVNSTISATFAIGSALAAIAGVLLCSFNTSLMPTTGSMPGIKAFTAAVFGGIGSIPGAFLGGLLLGIIEAMAKAYNTPELCNSFCARECPLGRSSVSEVDIVDFDRLALKVLGSLKDIDTLRASLIAISEDGIISEDERPAFQDILDSLEKISTNAKALKLWAIKNIHIKEEDV